MAVYTFLISTYDKPDRPITMTVCKKMGDVISVRKDGLQIANKQARNSLLVRVECGNIRFENIQRLRAPQFADLRPWYDDARLEGAKLMKRRFSLDLNNLKTVALSKFGINLDLARVNDVDDEYQPLTEVVFDLFDVLYDKQLKRLMKANDVSVLRG